MATITTKQEKQLHDDAIVIADIVTRTNTDHRHLLYDRVSNVLRANVQGYSARLFGYIADKDKNAS